MPNKTLSDKNDIKILVLYMINNVSAKMTEKVLTEILITSSFVDYFTLSEVIEEMLIAGLIDKVREEDESVLKWLVLDMRVFPNLKIAFLFS